MHSGGSFWTDLVAIFTRAFFCKHPELCCCNFKEYGHNDKMGGLSPPCFQSGGGGGGAEACEERLQPRLLSAHC